MNLPFLRQKKEDKEYFLALLLSSGEIRSILFEKNGESLLILASHSQEFSEPLDTLPTERLTEISDVVISEVERVLPEGSALEKTIFAVPDRWITDGKIIREHLLKLKAVCDALHLTPVGFIVSIEAIIAYLHKKQGVPVTAIVVEIGKKHVTMSLIKNGNILLVSEHEIEHDAVTTVEKMLSTQEELEVLPAKIILLNFEAAKKIQQAFLSHSWSKSLQFLHLPQVEVLDPEVESQAVISGVAAQMGFNTLPDVNIDALSKKNPVEVIVDEAKGKEVVEEAVAVDETSSSHQDTAEEVPTRAENDIEFKGEAVGFFKDVDVLKQAKEEEKAPVFAVAEDEIQNVKHEPIHTDEEVQSLTETHEHHAKMGLPVISRPHLPHIAMKTPSMPKLFKGRATFLYPVAAVVIFILLIVSYYYFFEKVDVTVYLDKKGISKELTVAFAKDKPTSAEDSVVHIDTTSVQVDGKEEQSTTGKKETGDKAKGEVTIYNKTDSSETFAKGTQVIGPNNLVFNLTEEVKIASTSSFSPSFSSSKGKVEADKFGKEYNIPSGSNFQIKGQSTSDYFGKNDSAFSGGTKKEVTVVSADDISSLQTKILETLSKKAMNDGTGKIGSDSQILNFPLDTSFDEKSFSKKEGDAAESISLAATITYTLGSYKKSDLVSLAKDITAKEAPSDYSYSGKDSEIAVKDIENNEGDVSGKLVFTSVFLPQVSGDTIAAKIAGKSTEKADEIIQTDGVKDDKVVFLRSLPFFPKILPFNKNNIIVTIQTQ